MKTQEASSIERIPSAAMKASILLVDDRPANLLALEAILDSLDQHLVRATSGEEALEKLQEQEFAVILMDVRMPGMDGLRTAEVICQRESAARVPIIFLTAVPIGNATIRAATIGIEERFLDDGSADLGTLQTNIFALERNIADVVLRSLVGAGEKADTLATLDPIDDGPYADARASGGAIYPDGFAVIGRAESLGNFHVLVWDPNDHRISNHEETVAQQLENEQLALLQQTVEGESLDKSIKKSPQPLQT